MSYTWKNRGANAMLSFVPVEKYCSVSHVIFPVESTVRRARALPVCFWCVLACSIVSCLLTVRRVSGLGRTKGRKRNAPHLIVESIKIVEYALRLEGWRRSRIKEKKLWFMGKLTFSNLRPCVSA